ncbi:trypsin-like peptidase domain-containing protein [Chloroflexota bacterium]
MMKRMFQWLGLPLVLVLLLASLGPTRALDRKTRLDVMAAVVQISWVSVEGDNVYGVGVGSGTIISPDGLILTNAHVADPIRFGMPPERIPEFDYLGIGLTVKSDQPPRPTYLAEVVASDPSLDLAVIRITRKLDLRPVNTEDLNLPYVETGDSGSVEVGDELNIFGYPGIGGETITFTKGVVSGFSLDAAIEGRAWIKTDATIAGGNSGGTAVDEDGYLVGVPTRAGAGGGADYVDCRPLADTNNDGQVDDGDTCVPVGGFINALRPLELTRALIEAARLGVSYQGQADNPATGSRPVGEPRFSNLFFSTGVNEFSQPTAIVPSLPSGARSLYLFFDYENMAPGKMLEMKVSIDGQEAPEWGLPASPWGGDEEGTWWIGWDDADFGDGTHELALYVDGKELAQTEIEIGGPVGREPAFSNLVFSLGKTAQNQPLEPAVLFPAGTKVLYAFFDYENMVDGLSWTRTWSVDGQVGLTGDEPWDGGAAGVYSLDLANRNGLSPGAYRLELLIEDRLAAASNFWVTGGQDSAASFGPVTFSAGVDARGNPVDVATNFASGLVEMYAFSDYDGMEDGLDVVVSWYVNGEKVIESPFSWDGGASGTLPNRIYSTGGALPDGEYGLELVVEEQVLQTGSATVGGGAQPTAEPSAGPRDGVQVQGTITDLDTGRPIPGASFLVLNPGISLAGFQWTDSELYTAAEADRQGFYRLPRRLERGQCYSVLIGADGYWTHGEDDVCVDREADSLVELPVRLERK